MTVEHPDHDLIAAGQRTVQQLLFTASQVVEAVAHLRAHTAHRGGSAAARNQEPWRRAQDGDWRRNASSTDLLAAWGSALTAARGDRQAAAAMLRVEHEMRRRWPSVMTRYDAVRVGGGVHPAAAMDRSLTEAAAAGWAPTAPTPASVSAVTADRSETEPTRLPPSEASPRPSQTDAGRSSPQRRRATDDDPGPHRVPGLRVISARGRNPDGNRGPHR